MSVLIKGMEMPKKGERLSIDVYPDGRVCINGEKDLAGRYACDDVPKLLAIPAADVRPVVRASWEEKEKDGVWWYACSVCGEHISKGRWGQEWHSNFCPNCGADMRGERDG